MLSPRELEREASIIIARLHKQKAWLENEVLSVGKKTNWLIVSNKSSRKSKSKSQTKGVPPELVEAMCTENWLSKDPTGALIVTAAGLKKFIAGSQDVSFSNQHQQQSSRLIKDDQNRTVCVNSNDTESPLGWMRARRDKAGKPLLTQEQFDAGERIRQDFTAAQMSARVTASWEFTGSAGGKGTRRNEGAMEISERAYAAKKRFFAALDILGPELSGIVYEICCLTSGLEAAERQLGWPRRSAKLVLTIALTKLSEHYGLVRPKARQSATGRIKQWGMKGYRPQIPPPKPV